MTIRERFGTIELVDDYDCVDLYADFEANAIGTNGADSYYNYSIPMAEFLKFADRIREKLKEQEGKK